MITHDRDVGTTGINAITEGLLKGMARAEVLAAVGKKNNASPLLISTKSSTLFPVPGDGNIRPNNAWRSRRERVASPHVRRVKHDLGFDLQSTRVQH